jgi:hypothetical protein
VSTVRKLLVAAIGGLAQVAASGTLPDRYQAWAAAVLAIATAAGVYVVPNAPRPATGDAIDAPA